MSIKIYCVVPAYNEGKNILNTVNKLKPHVKNIVVVDDGSTDDTCYLLKNENIVYLRHIINRGQGAALQTGNDYCLNSGAEIIIHFDADGQFLAEEIKDVVKPIIVNECEAVFGSRFLEKKSRLPFVKKYFLLPLAKAVNRLFFNIKATDPQNGFRAMSRRAAEKITIENDRMAHCSEILNKTAKAKISFKEVSVTVIYHNFGQKFNHGVKIVKDLLISKFL